MDEFEYRLEISDRDWECFFTECEGCNLLPPSLARMDDSGMSDFDDHFHGPRAQKVDPAPGTPVNDRPVNGPPNYSGSPPVEQWFGTHQNSEFDSVLSGSEEDIHLQSVNIFFERLKDLRVPEPDQERVEDNKEKQEEQQIRGRSLPKSCPNLNTPPDGVEEVFGKETQRPVDPIWNINTMKISGAESNFFSEPETCSTSPLSFCKSPETDLYITEGDFTDSILDEEEQENPLHDLKESLVASDTRPQLCRLEMWRSMDNIKQVDLLMNPETLCKKCSSRKDQISSPEGSQLVSLRRKRRRKRRLSLEAGEGGHPCERQSREEHLTVKEGRRLFVSTEMLDLKEHKNLTYVLTPNPATIKFPDNFSAQEIKISLSLSVSPVDNQCQPLQQRKCTDGNCLTNHTSKQPLSLGDDNDNDAAGFQSNGEFKVSESSSVDKSPSLAVSSAEMDTEKSKSQRHEVKPSAFKPSDERNVSVSDCKNEKYANHSTAEIKLISPLPSAESCANVMEILQTRKLSTAKSDLAAEAGNSGPGKHTQCPSNAEGQEQLESDSTNTNQSVIAVKETHLSVNTPGGLTSQPKAFQDKTLDEVISTYSTSEDINMLPNKSSISGNTSDLDTGQQTCPPEYLTSFCFSAKHKKEETLSMLNSITNTMLETEAPKTEDVQMSPFDITPMSFHNTLDIESVLPPSSENISLGFCSSIRDYESAQEGNEMQTLLATGEVKSESSVPKREDEIQSDFPSKLEGVINASIDVDEPEKIPNSVVVMSSFWREMEKLTINDILGLRNAGKSTLPDALPALNEFEETGADSGIYTEEDEPKTEEAMGEMCKVASSSSRTVTWQSEPVLINQIPDIGHGRTVLESDTDSSQRVLTERAQNYLKKISKTLSVHNLPALESGLCSYTSKGDALEIFEEQETKSLTYFAGSDSAKKDTTLPSSSTNSYRISFSDIFQYFFGGKQLVSRQSTKVDTTTLCSSGSSVPETYDQFFSEFDNDGFFNPLITTKEKNKDKPVPIFSYSRSTSRNFQFPEAYEHFFALSSSDDSSSESDEEESCRPVRVVSRFSRKVSSTQITTDLYDNFFTDRDITENLFSLSLLSFRKLSFTAPAAQEEGANLLEPVRQRSRHQIQKMGFPVNALGSPAVMYPDPLLFHLEERISSQLAVQPCRYKGLDMAISDPRLDAPLLPLKQSDMCLVCIAFASWVLKTANSQADDAWKAVLLANVSALSAIRYLRKYVKVEAVTREMKSSYPALTES